MLEGYCAVYILCHLKIDDWKCMQRKRSALAYRPEMLFSRNFWKEIISTDSPQYSGRRTFYWCENVITKTSLKVLFQSLFVWLSLHINHGAWVTVHSIRFCWILQTAVYDTTLSSMVAYGYLCQKDISHKFRSTCWKAVRDLGLSCCETSTLITRWSTKWLEWNLIAPFLASSVNLLMGPPCADCRPWTRLRWVALRGL